MTSTASFSYYPINTADILQYEFDHYTPATKQHYLELYDYLQPFYLRAGIAPFLTWDMVRKKQASKSYYKRQVKLVQDENARLTIFSCKGRFYDMTEPCIIEREKVNGLDFQKLFAYKLRQYADTLLDLPDFLHFHLQYNFEQDRAAYSEFLRLVLVQYKHLFTENLTGEVQLWMQLHLTVINNAFDIDTTVKDGQAVSDRTLALENDQPPAPTPPLIPEGYRIIEGKWTIEQVQHFFSFLYLETSEHGAPFLSKEAFMYVFRYGIATPPEPLQNKYLLNVSRQYPLLIIYYSLYTFYYRYPAKGTPKSDLVLFFAHYFEQFESALLGERQLSNITKNVKNKKPQKMPFDLSLYLPSEHSTIK